MKKKIKFRNKNYSKLYNNFQKILFYTYPALNGASISADLYKQNCNFYRLVELLRSFLSKNLSLLCERYNLKLIW